MSAYSRYFSVSKSGLPIFIRFNFCKREFNKTPKLFVSQSSENEKIFVKNQSDYGNLVAEYKKPKLRQNCAQTIFVKRSGLQTASANEF